MRAEEKNEQSTPQLTTVSSLVDQFLANTPSSTYNEDYDARDFETVSSLSRMSAITDVLYLTDPEQGTGRILSINPPQPDEATVERPLQPPFRCIVAMGPVEDDPTFETIEFRDGIMKVGQSVPEQKSDERTNDASFSSGSLCSEKLHAPRRPRCRHLVLLLLFAFLAGSAVAYVKINRESSPEEVEILLPTEEPLNSVSETPSPAPSQIPTTSAPTLGPTEFSLPKGPSELSVTGFPTIAPTFAPSETETTRPTTLEEGILTAIWNSDLFNYTSTKVSSSPQHLAYQFLLETTQFEIHSPARVLQRYAMAVFYFSTGGDSWERNDAWLSSDDECQWYSGKTGSPCDSEGHLIHLNLSDNNLLGDLPEELGMLENLIEINLRGNDLVGQIPINVGKLWNLRVLDFSWTQIDGEIPNELSNALSLERINLVGTEVNGSIPFSLGELPNLEELLLARTKLVGTMPTSVCALTGLEELWADCDEVSCSCCNYCCYKQDAIELCQYV